MKKKLPQVYEFPVVIEQDEAGYYLAYAPSLQGCYTQGKSIDEALKNITEVIELHIEDRRAVSEAIPQHKMITFSSVQVAV